MGQMQSLMRVLSDLQPDGPEVEVDVHIIGRGSCMVAVFTLDTGVQYTRVRTRDGLRVTYLRGARNPVSAAVEFWRM